MYIVFVNNKPIFLSDKQNLDSSLDVCLFKDFQIEEVLHKIRHTNIKGIYLYHHDLGVLWKTFISHFKVIEAAGGIVIKDGDKLLLIYRNGHWDLPKGKMEQGETPEQTAIREVEEECGIDGLTTINKLQKTYHIFHEKNSDHLKLTHWFLMKYQGDAALIPQLEEGITKAEFIPIKRIPQRYDSMYANIKDLIQNNITNL